MENRKLASHNSMVGQRSDTFRPRPTRSAVQNTRMSPESRSAWSRNCARALCVALAVGCSSSAHKDVQEAEKPIPECVEFARAYSSCRTALVGGNTAVVAPQLEQVRKFAAVAPAASQRDEMRANCERSTAQLRANCAPQQVTQ